MASAAPQLFERLLTHRDLDDLPENDAERYEVIDGELYVASFPFVAHQKVATVLLGLLWRYLDEHPIGEVFTSNTKVVLDDFTGVGPDLVYVAREHLGGLKTDGFYGPPDLVVEVTSSKPNVDRVIKHRKYARSGVPHYWIIDPGARTLDVFELKGRRYKRTTLEGKASFSPTLFPGLVIPVARLWNR
jgi:Uma2 family endonuclease